MPCRNISATPEDDFVIDPLDYSKAVDLGPLLYVVHSHPDNSTPSSFDITSCNRGLLPWIIVDASTEQYSKLIPDKQKVVDLIGRPFIHGLIDCYTLVKDYYAQKLNIHLDDLH